ISNRHVINQNVERSCRICIDDAQTHRFRITKISKLGWIMTRWCTANLNIHRRWIRGRVECPDDFRVLRLGEAGQLMGFEAAVGCILVRIETIARNVERNAVRSSSRALELYERDEEHHRIGVHLNLHLDANRTIAAVDALREVEAPPTSIRNCGP